MPSLSHAFGLIDIAPGPADMPGRGVIAEVGIGQVVSACFDGYAAEKLSLFLCKHHVMRMRVLS